MNLGDIRQFVEQEIASYIYTVPPNAVGQPMSNDWVTSQLGQMRASLVTPIWRMVAIRDTIEQMKSSEPELRQCALVADDCQGYELYYDPVENEFMLACSGEPPTSMNVRGDAVGCFMAR